MIGSAFPRNHLYRKYAARLVRDIRSRRPRHSTALERRDWNLRTVCAVHNYMAYMHAHDKAMMALMT